LWHYLVHATGCDYGAPYGHWVPYNFWSGFGSDISELAIFGAVLGAWRKHVCHEKGCLRIGRHQVDGTPYCDRHHGGARKR
jgi:hypothetical protein